MLYGRRRRRGKKIPVSRATVGYARKLRIEDQNVENITPKDILMWMYLTGLMTFSTRIFIHDLLPIIRFSTGFSLVQL